MAETDEQVQAQDEQETHEEHEAPSGAADMSAAEDSLEETAEDSEDADGARSEAEKWKTRARNWERKAKSSAKEAASLKEAAAREALVRKIAGEQGVDAEVLIRMQGSTDEEISENAELLKVAAPKQSKFPSTKDAGYKPKGSITKDEILNTKNRAERLRLIRENQDLFE
ncbi:MAG: hypothetical protein HFJ65_03380 [Eggerthellaceae bacterium]|nr:hypothetical protein [Eggerthellaceae bacterium]